MGRSAERSAGAPATLTGGSGAGQPGGRTLPSADGRAGQIPCRLLIRTGWPIKYGNGSRGRWGGTLDGR